LILRAYVMAWGQRAGASKAYLQVEVDNVGAQALYASLGFEVLADYTYVVEGRAARG